MKKVLALLFVLSTFLYSNEFTNKESSAFSNEEVREELVNTSTPRVITSKNLYLSYLNYPKHVYKNQRFEIEVKALITRKNFNRIETKFIDDKNMTPLNPFNEWVKEEGKSNTYTNKYYFKAYEKDFIMPTLEVSLYNNEILIETRFIYPSEMTFSEIAKSDERFSNIIAKQLTLVTSKAKQYTNKEALAIIDLKAIDSNLEDFFIKGIEEQGITLIEDNYPEQHIIYYLVIPIHKKSIIFNYYNTDLNSFQKVVIPVTFEEELVSTQTDLNPNNSNFEFYKKIAIGLFSLLLFILFIWKRKYIFLVLFLISTIVFILFAMPNKTIKLKENTVIYILPTKNSTIFQKTTQVISVEDMKRKNGFVKIMFGSGLNNYIGWVKEEDVIKN